MDNKQEKVRSLKIPYRNLANFLSNFGYWHTYGIHHALEIFPVVYPEREKIEHDLCLLAENRLGILADPMWDILPVPFWKPLIDIFHAHPDITDLIQTELDELLYREIPDLIPRDAESKQTFQYLGFEKESFIPNIRQQIIRKLKENDIPSDLFENALSFAEEAYQASREPERKSGEKYICHPLRMIWYFLTEMEETGSIKHKPEWIKDVINGMLFHDIGENIEGTVIKNDTLNIPSLDGFKTFPLTLPQSRALMALIADKEETYLQDVINEDPSGMAALIKLYDRLDNLFTLWYPQNWLHLLRKLYESYSSMGTLGWAAKFSGKTSEKIVNFGKIAFGTQWESVLSVNLIAFSLFEAAFERMKQLVYNRLKAKHGIDLRNNELDRWIKEKTLKHRSIAVSDIQERFSLNRIVEEYSHKKNGEPFGFKYIVGHLKRVKDVLFWTIHIQPYFPGRFYDLKMDWLEAPLEIVQISAKRVFYGSTIPNAINIDGKGIEFVYNKEKFGLRVILQR